MQVPGTGSRNLYFLFSYLLLVTRQSKLVLKIFYDNPNDKICVINTAVFFKNIIVYLFLNVPGFIFKNHFVAAMETISREIIQV
jgi:hypothetical protein